jgi:hypothetical protein
MEQIKRLVLPEPIEIVVFLILSTALLLIENIKRFWLVLQGDMVIVVKRLNSTDGAIGDYIAGIQQFISPKLVDFLLWALIGCFVFIVASLLIAFIKTLGTETELLHYYRSPFGRAHELNSFLTKIIIRVIGILSLLLWFGYFTRVANPYLVKLFFTSLTSLKDPASWLWLLISITLFTICIYFFAILIRLIALRPRIFGAESELK